MARIRTVKPEFWTDETLAEMSRDVRLLFLGLLNHVDDEGRCVDNEKLVKAAVFPLDDDVPSTMVRRWLDELSTTRRVVLYEVAGRRYLQVANFKKHQKIDRPKTSTLPPPDDGRIIDIIPGQDAFVDASTNDRRPIVDASLLDQGSGKGTGNREQGTLPACDASTNALPVLADAVAAAPAARGRNELFDALAASCGIDPEEMTDRERRATGVALAEIRKAWKGDPHELQFEMRDRALRFVAIFPHASLTPNALANQWSKCTPNGVRAADPKARKDVARALSGQDDAARKARILAKVDQR